MKAIRRRLWWIGRNASVLKGMLKMRSVSAGEHSCTPRLLPKQPSAHGCICMLHEFLRHSLCSQTAVEGGLELGQLAHEQIVLSLV
ncbi:unnamed protein product [Protopolystoma xenopodis]|uniref:Uncharacterized protein n=1 Tax=Protopolystoma xenopodis TaxID=117903 RepID=A0A448XPZ7_9PLAT|nr:unnamed protein product [Protopolystoma xenopodis]